MKKMMFVAIIITAFMLLTPLAVLGKNENKEEKIIETGAVISTSNSDSQAFRVYDKQTQRITEMTVEDYIFGVVAAEMPALYDTEAIKAQAVAAYTYALYKKSQNKEQEYDITTDFATDQSFKTDEKAREDWGEKADEYVNKIKSAVKSVKYEKVCYENKPILAVYHAVSCGVTYSAKDVWGKEIEYLKSVSSEGDKLADNYTAILEFSEEQLNNKTEALISEKKENTAFFSDIQTNESGLVEYVKIYGNKVEGNKIREALELPSANFKFEKQDGRYIFTCLGYGHGVGMSQKGADYMAKQGYSYKEILLHYYKNTVITK